MNLDTNIAMGVRPPPIDFNAMNQGNVLANMAQLRSADNQNALAQYQLSSAKRSDASQEALMRDAQDPNFKMTFSNAIKYGPLGMTALKAQLDAETKALERTKIEGEIATSAFALEQKKLIKAIRDLINLNTAEEGIAAVQKSLANKNIDQSRANQLIKDLQTKPFEQVKQQQLMGLLEVKDQLSAMLPKTVRQDTGSAITSIQDNPMLPGYGKPIAGADITKTETFADLTAAKQATTSAGQLKVAQGNAATSAGQLKLAKDKYAFELANPIKTLVEGPNQTAFGFNPLNSQMTPVINAPVTGPNAMAPAARPSTNSLAAPAPAQAVAPAAKPLAAAGGSGPLGVNLPANAAAGVNAPGTPFVGKSREAPAKFNDTDLQLAGLAGSLKEFKDEVSKNLTTGAKFLFSGQDTARMTAKYTALLMGVKDLYTLGALTGPDMSIIESQITNPASWSGKMTSKEGFAEQAKVIEDMLKRTTTNIETTYGRTPKAARKALEALPGSASGITGATPTNPMGLTIPGVR